ncbi:MAG: hypothetical protein RL662_1202 [Bacteroidota bacterium]|jgi:hypothetical protein
MRQILFLLFVAVTICSTQAQVVYTHQDVLLYEKCISELKPQANLPINELLIRTALHFKDTPYVASTLDNNNIEQLMVNLRAFDCTTFVETCIALARTLKSGNYEFSNFCDQLQLIRYRGGEIDKYTSRLHYMTDWVYDNEQKGVLVDKSKSLGGKNSPKAINFMSIHPDAYNALKDNRLMQNEIVKAEQTLNQRASYSFIPKTNLSKIEKKVKNGDILIFATAISGLDYSHVGIAYHNAGVLTFIHASTKTMQVIVEPASLQKYCTQSTKCTGVSVSRINQLINQ